MGSPCSGSDFLTASWRNLENNKYHFKNISQEFEDAVTTGWLTVHRKDCKVKPQLVSGNTIKKWCHSTDAAGATTTSTCEFTFNPKNDKTVKQVYDLLAKLPALDLWTKREKTTKRYQVVLKFSGTLVHKFEFAFSGTTMQGQIWIYPFKGKAEKYTTLLQRLHDVSLEAYESSINKKGIQLDDQGFKMDQKELASYLVNNVFLSPTDKVSGNFVSAAPPRNIRVWNSLMDLADVLWMAEAALPQSSKLVGIKAFVMMQKQMMSSRKVRNSTQLAAQGPAGAQEVAKFENRLVNLMRMNPSGRVPEVASLINDNILEWWTNVSHPKNKSHASWLLMRQDLIKHSNISKMLPLFALSGSRRQQAIWVNGMCGPFIESGTELLTFLDKHFQTKPDAKKKAATFTPKTKKTGKGKKANPQPGPLQTIQNVLTPTTRGRKKKVSDDGDDSCDFKAPQLVNLPKLAMDLRKIKKKKP